MQPSVLKYCKCSSRECRNPREACWTYYHSLVLQGFVNTNPHSKLSENSVMVQHLLLDFSVHSKNVEWSEHSGRCFVEYPITSLNLNVLNCTMEGSTREGQSNFQLCSVTLERGKTPQRPLVHLWLKYSQLNCSAFLPRLTAPTFLPYFFLCVSVCVCSGACACVCICV